MGCSARSFTDDQNCLNLKLNENQEETQDNNEETQQTFELEESNDDFNNTVPVEFDLCQDQDQNIDEENLNQIEDMMNIMEHQALENTSLVEV